jgi:hypothetical protein
MLLKPDRCKPMMEAFNPNSFTRICLAKGRRVAWVELQYFLVC